MITYVTDEIQLKTCVKTWKNSKSSTTPSDLRRNYNCIFMHNSWTQKRLTVLTISRRCFTLSSVYFL